jgi:hypothetical protein
VYEFIHSFIQVEVILKANPVTSIYLVTENCTRVPWEKPENPLGKMGITEATQCRKYGK